MLLLDPCYNREQEGATPGPQGSIGRPSGCLRIEVPGTTQIPGSDWTLRASVMKRDEMPGEALNNADPWQAYLDLERTGDQLTLRARRTGDRFHPLGMSGKSKSLNAFLIDVKVPHLVRDHLPLVVSATHIVWVAGQRIDERAKITDQTRDVLHLRFTKEG